MRKIVFDADRKEREHSETGIYHVALNRHAPQAMSIQGLGPLPI